MELFKRDTKNIESLKVVSGAERSYIVDTLLTWVIRAFQTEISVDDLVTYLTVLSKHLGERRPETNASTFTTAGVFAHVCAVLAQQVSNAHRPQERGG